MELLYREALVKDLLPESISTYNLSFCFAHVLLQTIAPRPAICLEARLAIAIAPTCVLYHTHNMREIT